MQKRFFILIGRSGCGKGTQATLLKEYLEKEGYEKVIHITTGGGFREFVKSSTYLAEVARKVNDEGGLQPEFLAIWNWANIFNNTLMGGETIILDGAPRKLIELEALESAVHFLEYNHATIIFLNVSEGWSRARLLGRGREDDKNEEEVTRRMNWYETDVLPVVDRYNHDPRYKVLHINGEQTVEEVHKEIVEKMTANA